MVTKVVIHDPAIAASLMAKGYKLIDKRNSDGKTEFVFPDSRELCAEVFTNSKQTRGFAKRDSVVRTPDELIAALTDSA
jgi:hypothetical protein